MTKMNWDMRNREARARKPDISGHRVSARADRILTSAPPQSKVANDHGKKSYRVRKHQQGPREVWIVVGADCPWNTTPGVRQIHHFESVEAAHRAGFTSVR